MKTLREVLGLACEHLEKKGIASPRREAEDVLSVALKMPRLQIYMDFDKPLMEDELIACREVLRRRALGEPLAYIAGSVEFYNCLITLSPHVLIPRPETELLVDKIVKWVEAEKLHTSTILDLCTGSGCIAIALKKHFPSLNIMAADISEEALGVARLNAEKNHAKISFIQGDFLGAICEKVDVIVCNPPYISEKEFFDLDPQVKNFEPALALIAKNNGFDFYEKLANDAYKKLNPGGKIWLEIGYTQGEKLLELFQTPNWQDQKIEKDLSGHPRYFFATLSMRN